MAKTAKKDEVAELVADDPFVETAHRYADWVEKNLRMVIGAAVGTLVVVGVALAVHHGTERSASSLTSDLTKAIEEYQKSVDLQTVATSTVPEKLKETWRKALPAFEEVILKKPGSGPSLLAGVYAADLHRRLGEHDKAEALYKTYLDHTKADDPIRFLALEGAGYAAEEQGKDDEALGYYNKLIDLPGPFYEDYGLSHKARILEKKGDKAGAIAAYKAILALTDSKLREHAEERLAALE